MTFHISKNSSNKKTGDMYVTTSSRKTCPKSCPFKNNGCYADGGPLRLHWERVSRKIGVLFGSQRRFKGTGLAFTAFISQLKDLPRKVVNRVGIETTKRLRLWQAGDMPGDGIRIDSLSNIKKLISSLRGLEVFGYTHYPVEPGIYTEKGDDGIIREFKVSKNDVKVNRQRIKYCNDNGVTINLSANNPSHADSLANLNIAPVCTTLPIDAEKHTKTPDGRDIFVCPAVLSKNISCSNCGGKKGAWCQRVDRDFIVGFPAHGFRAKNVTEISK